jgi:deoxyribodipyrimidine photo-lyase
VTRKTIIYETPISVVWFKRDLRTTDHLPLATAGERGAIIPLYIIEPSLHQEPDFDPRHWAFIRESLLELRERLATLGAPLVVRVGEVMGVLSQLHDETGFDALFAHEETGNDLSYARDIAVREWTKGHGIPFYEMPNGGVIRVLKSRDQWSKIWEQRMAQPEAPEPSVLRPLESLPIGEIPIHVCDKPITHNEIQHGGSSYAHTILHSFLYRRGNNYHREMSSPVTAYESCSRLSPHLAFGTISMREAVSRLRARQKEIYSMPPDAYKQLDGSWKTALRSFNSRLHWRDHFMQKLEDEPEIEWQSFIPAFDNLRPDPETDPEAARRLDAWQHGQTGYPLVDAVMRSLAATGYTNFRMRAMLTSFASYDLWLPWQTTGTYLARMFTDYEPGIHWSQMQMQSGTTGINTVRVYNPTKQAQEQDPTGEFIRRWVPELEDVPDDWIHSPWEMPPMIQAMVGVKIGTDYPTPIVDHKAASKYARDQIYALRKDPMVKAAAERVYRKHGSRKKNRRD